MIKVEKTLNGHKIVYEYVRNGKVKAWCSLTIVEDQREKNGFKIAGHCDEGVVEKGDEDVCFMRRTMYVMEDIFNEKITYEVQGNSDDTIKAIIGYLIEEIEM